MRRKENDERLLTEYDRRILGVLQNASNGLRQCELRKEVKNPKTLSKILKRLEDSYLVKRIVVENSYPPKTVYKLIEDIPPTDKDLCLVYEAVDGFKYLGNVEYIASILKAKSWLEEEKKKAVKETYLMHYPYYAWCLSYASRAESDLTRKTIVKIYIDALIRDVSDWIDPKGKRYQIYKELINFGERYFNEEELQEQLNSAKELFVSSFPSDLQDLASSYFSFYFLTKHTSGNNILQAFQGVVSLRPEKKRLEEYHGEYIPRHRLNKFLQILTDLCEPNNRS